MSMCASAGAARGKPLQRPADRQDVSPLGLNRSTRLIATATTLGPPKACDGFGRRIVGRNRILQ